MKPKINNGYETSDGKNLKVEEPFKTQAYRAADGSLWLTFLEATARNQKLCVLEQVTDFLSIPCILSVDEDLPLIAEYLVDNQEGLLQALTPPETKLSKEGK